MRDELKAHLAMTVPNDVLRASLGSNGFTGSCKGGAEVIKSLVQST